MQIPPTSSFEGTWVVTHATLPNGTFAYTGRIHILQTAATFQLTWDITAGRYVGIGFAQDEHLFVSCGEQLAGLGIALFVCNPQSAPSIWWSNPELSGSVGTGKFTTPWSGTFEGEHQLLQYLPDGQLYAEWSVTIDQVDGVYSLSWRKGTTIHFKGRGFATSQGLVVGWYPDSAQFAFLNYWTDPHDSQQLHATWLLGDDTRLGSETLTRL